MKRIILFVAVLGAIAQTSCVEKFSGNSGKEPEKFTDLQVPASFDWTTTRNVTCNVESADVALVSVSDSPSGEPYATFFAGGKLASQPVSLNIPASVNTLYISYATTSGQSVSKAVNATGDAVSFAVGSGNRPFDDSDMEQTANVVFIPARANGWATMMFEDQWPGYGDYDFNDVVFNYKVQLYLTGANKVEAMQVGLRMKAVSGSFPYEIYLQMHGLTNDKVDYIERVAYKNTLPGANVAMTLLDPTDPTKQRALFHFDGLRGNVNRQPGTAWVNTEHGYELSDDQLVEASYVVYFSQPVDMASVNFAGLDFFLARNDGAEFGPEIHRCNYEPVNENLYFSLTDNPNSRDYFKSKDNLVWAVNIPADVDHAYEKENFLDAYPEFKTWAQSAGTQAKEWYKHGEKAYLVSK